MTMDYLSDVRTWSNNLYIGGLTEIYTLRLQVFTLKGSTLVLKCKLNDNGEIFFK